MTFGLTRDSALWTLAAVIACMGYLMTLPPPTEWTYYQWLQTAAAAALWISGKLSTSPVSHSEEGDAKITPNGR